MPGYGLTDGCEHPDGCGYGTSAARASSVRPEPLPTALYAQGVSEAAARHGAGVQVLDGPRLEAIRTHVSESGEVVTMNSHLVLALLASIDDAKRRAHLDAAAMVLRYLRDVDATTRRARAEVRDRWAEGIAWPSD